MALCAAGVSPLHLPRVAVSFDLSPGETVQLLGRSGAGKSSVLRALARLDPYRGELSLDGAEDHAIPAPRWRRQVSLLISEPVGAGVAVGAWLGRPRRFEAARGSFSEDAIDAELSALDLDDVDRDGPVDRLSAGEQARLRLARCLAGAPTVLLVDEPTAHLDDEASARVWARLDRFLEAGGALVLASHRAKRGTPIALEGGAP